jgi:hypothetical protein
MKTKSILKLLSNLLVIIILFSGCDKVEGPYGVSNSTGGSDTITGDTILRKVLLEDYTGHTCQACPLAHVEAKRLHDIFGDRVVVLGIHAGFFAKPSNAPFTADYRNPISTEIATDFGAINLPFPKGMVNRLYNPVSNSTRIFDYIDWETSVDTILQRAADAGLKITTSFNSADSTMTATVATTIVNDFNSPVNLAVYFAEDSIISPQKNGTVNELNYVHRHVLRGAFNGTYGEQLGATVSSGQTFNKTYSTKLTPTTAVPSKVSVYAVLFNNITKEVIQVEEKKLIP